MAQEAQPWRRRLAQLSGQISGAAAAGASTTYSAISSLTAGQAPSAKQGIVVGAEVARALREGAPVVALESTIISHGMPYPQNLATAQEVEAIVRQGGAVPATVAVLDGVPHVGLTAEQLQRIAEAGPAVRKTSRRDLPVVAAQRCDGATTVSATMLLAARVGIAVFVTGGIGGVHRGGETTMDVSADLTELGRSPVAVVCAGVKSVLDIPRTLEYLETQGVCVCAYGTDEFPAFFTRRSGSMAPARADDPDAAARMISAALQLDLDSGIVIGVPIPDDATAHGARVEAAVEQALKDADRKRLTGNEITPYLLGRIRELTGGASLDMNIRLVKNNATVGTAIAVALSRLGKSAI